MTTHAVNWRKRTQNLQLSLPKYIKIWEGNSLSPEDSIINVALSADTSTTVPIYIEGVVVGVALCHKPINMTMVGMVLLHPDYKYLYEYLRELNIVIEVNLDSPTEQLGLSALHLYEHIRL